MRLREIIFGAETRAGKAFDVMLLIVIACSVGVVMLDSVATIHQRHAALLYRLEWGFTILFTVEYLVRLWCVDRPRRYAFSFFGVGDAA